jgi:hypothetical protein
MIARPIGREALVQGLAGVIEQLRRAALDLRRLGALCTESGGSWRAFGRADVGWRLTCQIRKVVGLDRCRNRLGAETGNVGSANAGMSVPEIPSPSVL